MPAFAAALACRCTHRAAAANNAEHAPPVVLAKLVVGWMVNPQSTPSDDQPRGTCTHCCDEFAMRSCNTGHP
jgi:hypothetical protein